MGRPHPYLSCLFFSILKSVPFKKLNGVGRVGKDGKILKPVLFTFDFCFYFLFLYFYYIKIKKFNMNPSQI